MSSLSIVLATLLILLPGAAWVWSWGEGRTTAEKIADAIGISLAIGAIGGLLTFYLGTGIPSFLLIGIYAICAILLLRSWKRKPTADSGRLIGILEELLPILILALVIGWRFYQARDLVLPAWVDSVHHTLLTRIILETGGVPPTLEPYLPVPWYYHFGFHVNAALFAGLSRTEPSQAVLIFGQMLNAAMALAVYRLARTVWQDWRPAVVAMILVGFVFQMPAYYLTWGRYTLLTGLILLALGMAQALELADPQISKISLESRLRLAVMTAGILLTHVYAAGLFAVFLVTLVLTRPGNKREFWRSAGFRTLLAGSLAGLLVCTPWLWRAASLGEPFLGVEYVASADAIDQTFFADYLNYLWYLLGPYRSHILHALGLIGLLAYGLRGYSETSTDRAVRPVAVWTGVIGLLSQPWGLHLAPFRPDHGVIVAFLPAATLAGAVFQWKQLGRLPARLVRSLSLTALAALSIWGLRETATIVNPVTVLAGPEDRVALEWVEANVSADAVFFIATTAWQAGAYRGVDGGWWLLPLTGRQTLLPPALYMMGEPGYARAVNDRAARAAGITGCSDEFWALVEEAGLTHAYLSREAGRIDPIEFGRCGGVSLLFDSDGVFIFSLAP